MVNNEHIDYYGCYGDGDVYGHAQGLDQPFGDSGSNPFEKRTLSSKRDNQHKAVRNGQPFSLGMKKGSKT